MCDFIVQLVEHRIGIRKGDRFKSVEALVTPLSKRHKVSLTIWAVQSVKGTFKFCHQLI